MKQIKETLGNCIEQMENSANLLYQQDTKKAYDTLGTLLPEIVQAIDSVSVLKKEKDTVYFEDTKINNALQEMLKAMEARDEVLLADTIIYEVKEEFVNIMNSL